MGKERLFPSVHSFRPQNKIHGGDLRFINKVIIDSHPRGVGINGICYSSNFRSILDSISQQLRLLECGFMYGKKLKKHSKRVLGDRICAHSWSRVQFYDDSGLTTSFWKYASSRQPLNASVSRFVQINFKTTITS